MMNQGGNNDTVTSFNPNALQNHQVVDASQVYSPYYPSASISGPEAIPWTMPRVDNSLTENGMPSNSSYHFVQHTDTHSRNAESGSNTVPLGSSNLGAPNAPHDYNGYTSYPVSTDPYGYGNTGYQNYYHGYQQQSNNSYIQPTGAYQNTGAPYQPLSSFENSGSYTGSTDYSSTYYNPGDYQTSGGYPSRNYSNQTNTWNGGNYANCNQYPNYAPESSSAYSSSSTTPTTSVQYQQQYKQWADYYSQTEVSCAPGTETVSVTTTSSLGCPIPGVSSGYLTSNGQLPQPSTSLESPLLQSGAVTSFAQDNYWKHGGAPGLQNHHFNPVPDFQNYVDTNCTYNNVAQQMKPSPAEPNLQYPSAPLVPQSHPAPFHTVPPAASHSVSKLQIQTNPRIASNMSFGTPKINQDSFTSNAAVKPAYISVSLPKPNDKALSNDAADSMLKPVTFPTSLRGYVERALARCKDDVQVAACQAVMKEMITKATADGTLNTRDWDTEPLFPVPNAEVVHKGLQFSTVISSIPKLKRSPSRRSKSRWEPVPEEKPIDKTPAATINHEIYKLNGWTYSNEKDKKSAEFGDKEETLFNLKLPSVQKSANKDAQMPFKRQRLADVPNAADNGDAFTDSDTEQSLAAYYPGAITLANSPDERKKREDRSKRFDKGHRNRPQTNHFKAKNAVAGNFYSGKASALVISKSFEDAANRAVEDIDWDSLTVKGTCQEIEKRYLRLTSAPDPATVRPEDVLEKALKMVQNSHKNYLYKCDQLKSIRQDLTVQHIRNELTVKVYETHARLALEVGDLPEYNQCQSQLKSLYAEGIHGSYMEFSAYNLLCVILHSSNYRELLSSMSRLSNDAKSDEAVKHALAVRAAVTSGNYVLFFRLYRTAPNLNTCLMDLYVEKLRYEAVKCMSRSYRPTVPVTYISQVLGFLNVLRRTEESEAKYRNGLEECVEWLKAHGACLIDDTNGEMQLDTKASSSSLYMPEPDDAVAHGDANIAINDFFTRTS